MTPIRVLLVASELSIEREVRAVLSAERFEVRCGGEVGGERPETGAVRWADVVLMSTSGRELNSSLALLYGIAFALGRPVIFLGPEVVTYPALAAISGTLLWPAPKDALGFQLEVLGEQRAERRRKRQRLERAPSGPSRVEKKTERIDHIGPLDSLLEVRVLETLRQDLAISHISRDSSVQPAAADFLVWLEGAEPFNPIPIEVKGQWSHSAEEQLLRMMAAASSPIGVIVADHIAEPGVAWHQHRAVVRIALEALSADSNNLTRLVREARNRLIQGEPVGQL